jgi:large subunit ribosomal protein L3
MGQMILGRKGRMVQVFNDDGKVVPATIVEAGPCTVTQVKSVKTDGYNAVQLAFEKVKERSVTKPILGIFKKVNTEPHRFLREWRLDAEPTQKTGEVITCTTFKKGDLVDVIGVTKGRGTAGVMKRHGFHGRPASHGHMCHRRPGSIGMHSDPGRVFKGKKMAGHYGSARCTTKNLEVISVNEAENLILIKGAIPGFPGAFVTVRTALTGVPKAAAPASDKAKPATKAAPAAKPAKKK